MQYRVVQPWPGSKKARQSLVQVGSIKMPREFSIQVTGDDDDEPVVELVFEVRNGVPEHRGLHVTATEHGPELLCADWTGISKDDLLELAMRSLITHKALPGGSTGFLPLNTSEFGMHPRRGVEEVRRARAARKVKLTPDMLREVARIYRANVNGKPTAAVAEHFDKTHRTAALYVQRARRDGYLGAATKGKAGER